MSSKHPRAGSSAHLGYCIGAGPRWSGISAPSEDPFILKTMDLDLDLLASIASGGLGHWIEGGDGGSQTYVKDDDCIGK